MYSYSNILILKIFLSLGLALSLITNINSLTEMNRVPFRSLTETGQNSSLKYILQWTSPGNMPFLLMGVGRQGFINRNCFYTNCFVTHSIYLLGDYTKFDAILFYGPDIQNYPQEMFPQRRRTQQKYVFVSDKPSDNYPLKFPHFDGFFNWTWTYKLNSDMLWRHIVVTDLENNVIGPNANMNWTKREEMDPVGKNLALTLRGKNRAVFWMPSNCTIKSFQVDQVKKLHNILKYRYELHLDTYGKCGYLKCISGYTFDEDDDECSSIIRKNYYFYIVYEESLSQDYVTAEILPALKNNAIAIVYGATNYSRFLPDGSYLNARELGTEALALKIYQLIHDPSQYEECFKWTNHYRYYKALDYEDSNQCELCALLNDKSKVNQTSEYNDFRFWWNSNRYNSSSVTFKHGRPGKFSTKTFSASRATYALMTFLQFFAFNELFSRDNYII